MAHRSTANQQDDRPLPVAPPPSTLRALEEQTTPEVLNEVRRYAQACERRLRNAGRPVSDTCARELVDDVHADTRVGILRWDPARKLVDHLRSEIRKRTWQELRRARRVSIVSLQVDNDEAMSPQVERALAHATQSDCNPLTLHVMTATVCLQLRRLAPRDLEIAAVVACWEDGAVEQREILSRTGLTEAIFECVRKRIRNAILKLPIELCESAQDLLRNAS